jgi:beta-N-acetylhexosaminidase
VPYRALAGRGAAVMAGHLTVPGLTDGLPASISPTAIAYLRESLGYRDALILSDALGMAAIGLPEPDAAVRSIAAGVDVVLFTRTSQTGAVIDALVAAVQDGRITTDRIDAAAGRVMRQLAVHGDGCAATS